MSDDERKLLFTVARLMRARINDEVLLAREQKVYSPRDESDFQTICAAMKPFENEGK
jgi:hypothetical protein